MLEYGVSPHAFNEGVRKLMRRSATVVLIAVCGAAVLLIVAAGNSQPPDKVGLSTPVQVAGGFAALIASPSSPPPSRST